MGDVAEREAVSGHFAIYLVISLARAASGTETRGKVDDARSGSSVYRCSIFYAILCMLNAMSTCPRSTIRPSGDGDHYAQRPRLRMFTGS
jgi:hypothetical protein